MMRLLGDLIRVLMIAVPLGLVIGAVYWWMTSKGKSPPNNLPPDQSS